jgi:biopolymer transport protein ExbB
MDWFLPFLAQAADMSEVAGEAFGDDSWGNFPAFAAEIWRDGGWLMIPLFGLAALIYYEAMSLHLRMKRSGVRTTPRKEWEQWIDDPSKGRGHVGEVIEYVVGDGSFSGDALLRVEAVKARQLPDINSRITVLSVLVTIAPLMGLLGTVVGMLATFRVLASAASTAVELVAEGIRIALITTQTGLMIAIPGYIFIALVMRGRNEYLGFLAQLESIVVQRIHHKNNPGK